MAVTTGSNHFKGEKGRSPVSEKNYVPDFLNDSKKIFARLDVYIKASYFSEVEFKSFLERWDCISRCNYILGRDGYLLVIVCEELKELDYFLGSLKREISGICGMNTALLGRRII